MAARGYRAVPTAPDGRRQTLVHLLLFNGFELSVRGSVRHVPMTGQRLLAFLALQPREVTRGYLAGALWLDTSEDRAAASLRSTLWRLGGCGAALTESRGHMIALASTVIVDSTEMERAARCALDPAATSLPPPGILIDARDLLPGFYDEWVVVERERLRQLRLHALEAVCGRLTDARRYAEAVAVGLAAVASEPLRESAQAALVRAHLSEGNLVEALRQFASYREILRDELDLEPSHDFEASLEQAGLPLTRMHRRITRSASDRWSQSSLPTRI